ncbi:MAG TPA: sulfate permease [Bacteroidota bacterium]|nr:sulfate permease [Bacteroidota bacterium]
MPNRLQPKLFTVLKEGYTRQLFLSDITAGIIVGIVALPLAIAFAIASGVKPEQGLYTAIVAGVIVSVFGGSRVQIAGPTGAFIVIVYRIVQTYGYDGLVVATIMAGVLLIVMGLARFGTLLKFVPYPLTVGFTSGIALIIFSSQVGDFFGLRIKDLPADFVEKWVVLGSHVSAVDTNALGIGLLSLAIIVATQRYASRIPGSLVAILVATAVVELFHLPVETIGSRFGSVPNTLPAPHIPDISWQTATRLFSPAVTIALLGAIESLLSAVVADGMIRSRHRSNMELIAQGAANIVSPLFGGIPATGAIARTATNIKNGGRTPVSGIVHAVVLLLIMLVFGQWATLIPMPALAAILIVVSYNMSEWHSFLKILKSPRGDIAVMLVTFGLTVIVDLSAAIQIGVILSAMLFIKRMAEVSQVTPLTKDIKDAEDKEDEGAGLGALPDGVEVFEVYGSLFFGAVEQFTETIRALERRTTVFILETRNLLAIDATGIRAIEELMNQLAQQGTRFIISGIHKQPLFALTQAGLIDRIGESNLVGSLPEAIDLAGATVAASSSKRTVPQQTGM